MRIIIIFCHNICMLEYFKTHYVLLGKMGKGQKHLTNLSEHVENFLKTISNLRFNNLKRPNIQKKGLINRRISTL